MVQQRPRVLVKLSGEVLAGEKKRGLDSDVLERVAAELVAAQRSGAEAAIVQGGGNIFRGLSEAARRMNRVVADQIGMLATVINGLALTDAILRQGGRAALFTSFAVGPIGRAYSPELARAALEQGELAILAGGTGNPFFSTDSAAALRAAELGIKLILKGSKVDGVYDCDPAVHPSAKRFTELSLSEVIERRLGVIDLTAAALCLENGVDIRVYQMTEPDAIRRAALGESLGTLVRAQDKKEGKDAKKPNP